MDDYVGKLSTWKIRLTLAMSWNAIRKTKRTRTGGRTVLQFEKEEQRTST